MAPNKSELENGQLAPIRVSIYFLHVKTFEKKRSNLAHFYSVYMYVKYVVDSFFVTRNLLGGRSAGGLSLQANCWSSATQFPRQKNAVDVEERVFIKYDTTTTSDSHHFTSQLLERKLLFMLLLLFVSLLLFVILLLFVLFLYLSVILFLCYCLIVLTHKLRYWFKLLFIFFKRYVFSANTALVWIALHAGLRSSIK